MNKFKIIILDKWIRYFLNVLMKLFVIDYIKFMFLNMDGLRLYKLFCIYDIDVSYIKCFVFMIYIV